MQRAKSILTKLFLSICMFLILIKAKELLDLHIAVWDSGIKTSYYLRSTSN